LIDDHHTENVSEGIYTAISFLFGALISIISGYIGMKVFERDHHAQRRMGYKTHMPHHR